MRRALMLLAVVLGVTLSANAAVFQFEVPLPGDKGEGKAFLWVPPQAPQVRGVVLAGMTLMEKSFSKDPLIRKACADHQLAIVFLTRGLRSTDIQKTLDALAKVSGYKELSVAPLLFVGHSAGGPQAHSLAKEMASRCFGLVQYRGGAPNGVPTEVPCLAMVGQFDEYGGAMRDKGGREHAWERLADAIATYRTEHPGALASLLVEPGAGHFAWSTRNAKYLALWLGAAAEARIPKHWPVDAKQPVSCRKVDVRSGWLTSLDLRVDGGRAAPYDKYKGDKGKAAWHFNRALAEANVAFHADLFGRKDQFIEWKDKFWVDAGTRFFFFGVKWIGDGQTFEVHPVYAATYPKQHDGKGPRWPKAGQPVGHSEAPIRVRAVSGPFRAVGPNRFRIVFDALTPAEDRLKGTFLACSEGDKTYRYTERVGMLPRGQRAPGRGKAQAITFAEIPDMPADARPFPLRATSDAHLPVEYYVAHGPAVVEDGKLKLAEVPVRAKYPIEVTVIAYQFGRNVEPLVKMARPMARTFHITKPAAERK